MENIKRELAKGTFWIAFSKYTNQFIGLIISAILARLLTPDEFGVVTMVLVFTGFLAIFNDAGIKSFIIQHSNLSIEDETFVFFISLGIGFILTGILYFVAPLIEDFYHFEGLTKVTRVLSFQFIICTIGFVPNGILERELKFKTSGLIELFSSVASGIVGIVLAFMDFSYWALVIRSLLTYIFMSISFFMLSKWRPTWSFDYKVGKNILSYSGNLTLFGIINYWARNLDNLLVGKYLGASSLGFYNRAYSLMTYPITIFSQVINPILHPIFARIQADVELIRKSYLDVLKLLSIISFPFITFIVVNADSIITIVWGNQWQESVPVFRILGLAAMFQPILNSTGSIFLVRNKTNWLFKVGIVNTIVTVIGITIGLKFGIQGVAIGYVVSFYVMLLPLLYMVFKILLGGTLLELFKYLRTGLFLIVFVFFTNSVLLYFGQTMVMGLVYNAAVTLIVFILFVRMLERELYLKTVRKIKGVMSSLLSRFK